MQAPEVSNTNYFLMVELVPDAQCMPHEDLMSKVFCTWPQFCRRESVAARRLYQGILLFT